MKTTILLKNLDCANCAAKIERAVSALEGINHATVNFMTSKLIVETDCEMTDLILKVVHKTEPDVRAKILKSI